MGDRATLEKIYAIMRRLLLVKMDGLNPIPRKGTTRHECYRALYEIQELLETRRCFEKHLPQSNADRIRAMTDEELAEWLEEFSYNVTTCPKDKCHLEPVAIGEPLDREECKKCWLNWLRQEAGHGSTD